MRAHSSSSLAGPPLLCRSRTIESRQAGVRRANRRPAYSLSRSSPANSLARMTTGIHDSELNQHPRKDHFRCIRRHRFHFGFASWAPLIVGLTWGSAVLADEGIAAQIEHGRYIVAAAECAGCHTKLPGGAAFAGGRPIQTPFGVVVSSNITPDRETGIG